MRIKKNLAWVYYIIDKKPNLDVNKTGKWMYFFSDRTFVEAICKTAIKEGIVEECKHSNKEDGVSCFYLNDDDIEGHRRVIAFFIKNGLIQKRKTEIYTTFPSNMIARLLLMSMGMIIILKSNSRIL